MQPMYYIGLDVHKRIISYWVKDSSVSVVAMYPRGGTGEGALCMGVIHPWDKWLTGFWKGENNFPQRRRR